MLIVLDSCRRDGGQHFATGNFIRIARVSGVEINVVL